MTPTGQLSEFVVPTPSAISAITAGPDGKIWFAESSAGKIGRIDLAGFVEEFTLPTRADPLDIVSGADGEVWFTEGASNKIGRMSSTGQLLEYSLPDSSGLPSPLGIAASPDGGIWYVAANTPIWPSIGRLDSSGRVTQFDVSHVYRLSDLAVAPDGTIWYAGFSGYGVIGSPIFDSLIGRLHPDGHFSEVFLPDASSTPHRMAIAPDGNVWFAEKGAIGRITSSLKLTEFALAQGDYAGGIALDADGNLWVAKTNGFSGIPSIARLNPIPACRHCTQIVPFRLP
jgi:virginiamycin B lyase